MSFDRLFAARLLGAIALAALLGAPITRAQDSDPVLARANGVDIRQSDREVTVKFGGETIARTKRVASAKGIPRPLRDAG